MNRLQTILISAALLAGLASPALAVTITPHHARDYAGRVVTVRGVVDGLHDFGKVVFLYMDGRAPNNGLTVAVYPSAVTAFDNSAELSGKTVDVTGKVLLVDGKARIEARGTKQVFVKD